MTYIAVLLIGYYVGQWRAKVRRELVAKAEKWEAEVYGRNS